MTDKQQTANDVQMASSTGMKCYKSSTLDFCPKGHEMEVCDLNGEQGRYCKQCGDLTFQPNQNRMGDQCRLRRTCNKYQMKYKQIGDKTKNAECECELGYHFENEDQRACVPNKECGKGFGQGVYEDGRLTGTCDNCFEKNMWSDTTSTMDRCKPLRNCEKEGKCTVIKSNGTFDNKCGPPVHDVTDCDSFVHTTGEPSASTSASTVIGLAVGGAVICLLLVFIIIIVVCRRRKEAKRRLIRAAELEDLLPEIIQRSKKDEVFSKKALDLLQKEVEDRINNQIWALAQELFRNHMEPAKAEVVILKYQDQQHKFAINGYMQDWRTWRGNQGDAVQELVTCLQSDKVKRQDIVLEVVNKLREDFPEVVESYDAEPATKSNPGKRFCAVLFPCLCGEKVAYIRDDEFKDTNQGLLANEKKDSLTLPLKEPRDVDGRDDTKGGGEGGGVVTPSSAGAVYRKATTPSAPAMDEGNGVYPEVKLKGQHFYDRSDSAPVQASS
ncbi:uncharacterized protein LOC127882005 isoform X3 [Dreissena polymorpha]|uniref:uncharacterized protein LOC127882005 isoform X3 n=1 Tax=Dreissena polymorpha TaxID=45954 RepID=UPI002263CCA6|nr:uncharacterized protein LOC127882005 isoform X3 [Dreissena polymorpha]XP_052286325.1 uncharacterized protein LOC127882005 isoform X3 [Dreissena polymorpha]XP_052286326.1 uncharacterized protein LOC127882005 isoform X3 [Dreissena polymorpha]